MPCCSTSCPGSGHPRNPERHISTIRSPLRQDQPPHLRRPGAEPDPAAEVRRRRQEGTLGGAPRLPRAAGRTRDRRRGHRPTPPGRSVCGGSPQSAAAPAPRSPSPSPGLLPPPGRTSCCRTSGIPAGSQGPAVCAPDHVLDGFIAGPGDSEAYEGAWQGAQFVLTHEPPKAPRDPAVTFLSGDIADAITTARKAADGKNVEIFGADLTGQCLERGLIDEIVVHIVHTLLGTGTPFSSSVHPARVDLEPLSITHSGSVTTLRFRVRK